MHRSTLSLTPALDGGGWSAPRPGRFTLGKETRCPLYRRLGGAPGPVWTGAENLDPRTVQPVASRYTGYAIPAHSLQPDLMLFSLLLLFLS